MIVETMCRASGLSLLVALALTACAPYRASGTRPIDAGVTAPANAGRVLVIVIARAPETLGSNPLRRGNSTIPYLALRAFDAGLVLHDEREEARPYLAEAVPTLNTDSWVVSSDGRMETTYRLKPNLVWHDGIGLSADDFVFSWRVYTAPEFGRASSPPFNSIEEVEAPDARTVVVRWRQPYADADDLQAADFPPLPRHILEGPVSGRDPEALLAHPFWTSEYVGLGPYRLTTWDVGSFLEGQAFEGHALGRPRIDRIRMLPIGNSSAVLATLLSDAAHVAVDNALELQQAVVLDHEWAARHGGVVLRNPVAIRGAHFQLRPEFVGARGLLDVGVRKALVYATDRQSLADALSEGSGSVPDTFVLPEVAYYPEVDRAVTRYPFDPQRAEQLFRESGYAKGGDGFYASAGAERFGLEIAVTEGNPTEGTVMLDGLRRVGIDASLRIIPRAQTSEPYVFAHFPGIVTGMYSDATRPPLFRYRASELPRPETRAIGSNYSGFNNVEFERLVVSYETALSRPERNQYAARMLGLLSEEVPGYPLYHQLLVVAYASDVIGPMKTVSRATAGWNLHDWQWS